MRTHPGLHGARGVPAPLRFPGRPGRGRGVGAERPVARPAAPEPGRPRSLCAPREALPNPGPGRRQTAGRELAQPSARRQHRRTGPGRTPAGRRALPGAGLDFRRHFRIGRKPRGAALARRSLVPPRPRPSRGVLGSGPRTRATRLLPGPGGPGRRGPRGASGFGGSGSAGASPTADSRSGGRLSERDCSCVEPFPPPGRPASSRDSDACRGWPFGPLRRRFPTGPAGSQRRCARRKPRGRRVLKCSLAVALSWLKVPENRLVWTGLFGVRPLWYGVELSKLWELEPSFLLATLKEPDA